MTTKFLEDVHVAKALRTLQGAIETAAKVRGDELVFLYVVAGTTNMECGMAAVGFVNPSSAMIASSYLLHVVNSAEEPATAARAH